MGFTLDLADAGHNTGDAFGSAPDPTIAITCAAGARVFLAITMDYAGNAPTASLTSVTGAGVTWVPLGNFDDNFGASRSYLYYADCPTALSAATITVATPASPIFYDWLIQATSFLADFGFGSQIGSTDLAQYNSTAWASGTIALGTAPSVLTVAIGHDRAAPSSQTSTITSPSVEDQDRWFAGTGGNWQGISHRIDTGGGNVTVAGTLNIAGDAGAVITAAFRESFDKNLGQSSPTGSSNSIALTTTAVAAPLSRIIAIAGYFSNAENVISCADNSGSPLNWIENYEAKDANNVSVAVYSAYALNGLSSGTVITMTLSGVADGRSIAAVSFMGLASGTSGYLIGTPGFVGEFGTTDWATPNITVARMALLIAAIDADGAGGATGVVTSPATEIHDSYSATHTGELLTGYRIVTPGTYSVAGTFGSAPGEQKYAIIGYQQPSLGIPSVDPYIKTHPKYLVAGRSPV